MGMVSVKAHIDLFLSPGFAVWLFLIKGAIFILQCLHYQFSFSFGLIPVYLNVLICHFYRLTSLNGSTTTT